MKPLLLSLLLVGGLLFAVAFVSADNSSEAGKLLPNYPPTNSLPEINWLGSVAVQNWFTNGRSFFTDGLPGSNPHYEIGLRYDGIVVWRKINP